MTNTIKLKEDFILYIGSRDSRMELNSIINYIEFLRDMGEFKIDLITSLTDTEWDDEMEEFIHKNHDKEDFLVDRIREIASKEVERTLEMAMRFSNDDGFKAITTEYIENILDYEEYLNAIIELYDSWDRFKEFCFKAEQNAMEEILNA